MSDFIDTSDVTKLSKSGVTVYPPGKGLKPIDRGARESDEQEHYLQGRDFGSIEMTGGKVALRDEYPIAGQNTKNHTGWHYHEGDFHIVCCLKGTNDIEFEDGVIRLTAGCFVHIPAKAPHRALWLSPDAELLELSVPAKIESIRCPAPKARVGAT